jgi:hypothetical protein
VHIRNGVLPFTLPCDRQVYEVGKAALKQMWIKRSLFYLKIGLNLRCYGIGSYLTLGWQNVWKTFIFIYPLILGCFTSSAYLAFAADRCCQNEYACPFCVKYRLILIELRKITFWAFKITVEIWSLLVHCLLLEATKNTPYKGHSALHVGMVWT